MGLVDVVGHHRESAGGTVKSQFARRQNAGEDALAYADALYLRHLREPIPGVYAMDNAVYRELRRVNADMRRAFHEAEANRILGRPYTKADYLRGGGEHRG